MGVIAQLETMRCEIPQRREWTQHGMPTTVERRLLVRLTTDDGLVGWGEATALRQWGGMGWRYYGETPETCTHLIHDLFAEALLGSDPTNPTRVMASLDAIILGHPYAKATVEMALQDLRGKTYGAPLNRLLGGPYRDGLLIGHMIGMMSDEEALVEATRAIEVDGIRAFQVKVGSDPARDARVIAKLRRAVPDHVFLRCDANKGYGAQPKQAAANVRRLEEAGANAIEQPAASIEALAACRAAVGIPIIADEACWMPEDVLELWRAGAVDAISVYVAKAGGIERATAVARTAALVGYPTDVNGSLESGIGNAASVQVALASPSASLPSIIPIPSRAERPLTQFAGRYWTDDIVAEGYSYADGVLRIGDLPGLGIVVDEDRVARYATDRQVSHV